MVTVNTPLPDLIEYKTTGKIRVLLLYIVYPLAMGSYFRKALENHPDVDLKVCGPFTGNWIPWMGGMTLPDKYVKAPDIPLPFPPNVGTVSYEFVKTQLGDWIPDIVLTVDAGINWSHKPSDGIVATIATDPHCISGDMLLATSRGLLYAHEASLMTESVADKNGMQSCQGVFYKGTVPTRRFTLETGQYLVCTDDHLVETQSGFIEARELRVGDSVLMSRGTYYTEEGTDEDYSQGFIIGAFQGDGSFGSSDMIKFTIAKKEKETFGKAIKEHLFNGFGIDCSTDTKHHTSDNAKVIQVRRWGFYRFLKSLDLKSGKIPLFIRTRSKKFIGGYIAGLIAADGCSVNGIIQLTSKDENLIRELQGVLFYFGVISRIKWHIGGLSCYKPGTKYWDLYIASGNSHEYLKGLTGEIPGRPIRTDGRRSKDTGSSYYQYVKILDVEGAVKNYPASRVGEPVYDVINSKSQSFLANGVSVHNCLDYSHSRKVSDKFFNMQLCYSEPKDIYLPYAYSQYDHYPELYSDGGGTGIDELERAQKDTDCVLIGMPYENRVRWVDALRKKGISVIFENGPVFDEARALYNRGRVGLNWSSMNDLNARAFEIPAMKLTPVMNTVPDMEIFNFSQDVLKFSNLNEAIERVVWAVEHPDNIKLLAESAYEHVQGETYDKRIEQVLHECGF